MGSPFHVTIERSKHSNRCSRHCSGTAIEPEASCSAVDTLRRYCEPQTLATCWELLFAFFSTLITSAYTLHHELQGSRREDSELQIQASDPGHFNFILDPSPALMLISCLILGCSVSSFCYRRQEQDKFQALVFVLAIAAFTIFGFGVGINANLIMLGLVPWSLCFSMTLSTTVHWIVRRCSKHRSYYLYEFDEKERLIRH